MKHLLPFLGVAALLLAAPAFAQYMYLDVNKDGVCTSADVLKSTVDSVTVYLNTNHDANGTLVTCSDGTSQMTINSYEFILRASGTGTVTYGGFANERSEMNVQVGPSGAGGTTDYWIGFGGSTINPPGLYRLGTLAITVTGTPQLSIVGSTPINALANTSFGSQCPGNDLDNTLKLVGTTNGTGDWTDVCGTASGTPVKVTTWGAIKNIYK